MNTLVGRIVGIVLLIVVAYLATAFLPSFGGIIAAICGLGAVILVVLLILDLVRGAR